MSEPSPPAASPPAPAPKVFSAQAVHLVRTAIQSHLTLSQMADQKASILLGATFVVFTLAVGQAGKSGLSLPLLVLASFAFLSAVCAVMVVMPSIRAPSASEGVPDLERANILFFGVFTQMPEQEWADIILERLATDETTFRTMLRDVYQNGQVLQKKKYRYLGYAYRLFLAGLTATLLTFLLAGSFDVATLL